MRKSIWLLILAACLVMPYAAGVCEGKGMTIRFSPSGETPRNPLIGFAPEAQDTELCEREQLVYIGLYWSDWEPQEGRFDIAGFEERNDVARWKAEGKNAVLRFICDYPGRKDHMDIPQWLYDKTGNGLHYSGPYGRGYSPDYTDPVFIAYHEKAIAALAEYCNRDDFVAYVQLGSLGHWGEWHITGTRGQAEMPSEEIVRQYCSHYEGKFKNARILTRRNYALSVENGWGVYNDMAGDRRSTDLWLDWIREGAVQEAQGSGIRMTPYENFWETAPVGGELAGTVRFKNRSQTVVDDILSVIRESHMTFLGPNITTTKDGYEPIRGLLGYKLYVSEAAIPEDGRTLTLVWENDGAAPLYWDWPAEVFAYGKDGACLLRETTDLRLSELAPGRRLTTVTALPEGEIAAFGIRITDPEGKRTVRPAMDLPGPNAEGVTVLWRSGTN